MKKTGYNGKYIIELYSDSFKTDGELRDSYVYLKSIMKE